MPTLKNLLERLNRFVQEVVNSHDISMEEKTRLGWQLFEEIRALYPSLDFYSQKQLEESYVHLTKILRAWAEFEIKDIEQKLAYYGKTFQALRYLPGAEQTGLTAGIDSLRARLEELKRLLPRLIGEPGVEDVGSVPPELEAAKEFRKAMEQKAFADEASLGDAIAKTQAEIGKLESLRTRLDPNRDALWGKQAFDEIRALGELIQEWESQISYLKSQEAETRTWGWQEDKAKEETRRYVANVEAGLAEGKERLEAVKMLHSALEEVEAAFSFCEKLTSKALVQLMPGAIPTEEVDLIIDRFERILAGIRDRLPEAEVRDATRRLNRLKAFRAEMSGIAERLGYGKEVSAYEARQESEGILYFRSNLPSGVREILPAKDVEKLEEVASTGVNGAKEAISTAIIMAAKRNPERARAILGA